MRKFLCISLGLIIFQALAGAQANVPRTTHYDLKYKIDFESQRLKAEAVVSLRNDSKSEIKTVPILLYRLLKFDAVKGERGNHLTFHQEVVSDEGEPQLQINRALITLATPLRPGATTKLNLAFSGYVYGYPEVSAYVRESIKPPYFLIRSETYSYPIIGEIDARKRYASQLGWTFTYRVEVTVPEDYVAAMGAHLDKQTTAGKESTFVWTREEPIGQIDIGIAKFKSIAKEDEGLTVFYLPQHDEGAKAVLNALAVSRKFYSETFGEQARKGGYTVIEIPKDWGSQAPLGYMILTEDAFTSTKQLRQLYHEVAHSWNAVTTGKVQRARFFDESFAVYFCALCRRSTDGQEGFDKEINGCRKYFPDDLKEMPGLSTTPIYKYGEHELGSANYVKGPWALYVLHRLVGDAAFYGGIRQFLVDYRTKPATFEDFRQVMEKASGIPLRKFFNDWIYTCNSDKLLLGTATVDEMVAAVKE
ncbi:MAG: hypothetical protein JSS72_02765 [Armatimonadetes bacterium]|nr:hypothetical protein [Armatimonadota bacterium]